MSTNIEEDGGLAISLQETEATQTKNESGNRSDNIFAKKRMSLYILLSLTFFIIMLDRGAYAAALNTIENQIFGGNNLKGLLFEFFCLKTQNTCKSKNKTKQKN